MGPSLAWRIEGVGYTPTLEEIAGVKPSQR
jgi:hypothetical protein